MAMPPEVYLIEGCFYPPSRFIYALDSRSFEMVLPLIFGGRTDAIVDEEMGHVQVRIPNAHSDFQ